MVSLFRTCIAFKSRTLNIQYSGSVFQYVQNLGEKDKKEKNSLEWLVNRDLGLPIRTYHKTRTSKGSKVNRYYTSRCPKASRLNAYKI